MALYFMFTYITTTTTVPAFNDLMAHYHINLAQVNWTVAVPALGLAIGPLTWSSVADAIGRRIIFITGTVMALAATIGAAMAPTYGGYMVARFFQGLGVAPAATVGLAVINDMFFEHERGQKIGLWALAVDIGLLIGPLAGAFILLVNQAWIQWLTAILFGIILVAEIFFLPETLYPRSHMLSRSLPSQERVGAMGEIEKTQNQQHQNEISCDDSLLPRTTTLPFLNLGPVPGVRHPKPWHSLTTFIATWKLSVVSLSICIYSFGLFWWIMSVITYIPIAYAHYSPQVQGLLFIGMILGTLCAEMVCSGTLSDWIVVKLAQRNGRVKTAEMRLWLAYPAALLCAIGLILWGVSIDRHYHWIIGQIAFFLLGGGIQMGNTIIAAYVVDSYPLQSMAVITFYAVIINLSAFINPFFIVPWVTSVGYTWTFAAQGIITLLFSVPAIGTLHYFGAEIRARTRPPSWVNAEYET